MKYLTYIFFPFLFACGNIPATEQPDDNETENAKSEIVLTEAQRSAANIITGKLTRSAMSIEVAATGQIDVPPNQKAEIHSPIPVFVEDIRVLPGDQVSKGQTLAVVNHPRLVSLQQQYRELMIEQDRIQKQLRRKQELKTSGVSSQSEIDQLNSDLARASAQIEGVTAILAMLHIQPGSQIQKGRLIATLKGQVTATNVTKGTMLNPETTAFSLLNPGHKHLELNIFPNDALNLQKGQRVEFEVTNHTLKGEAKIHLINPIVSDNHAIRLHAHILGDESPYIVGDFVTATIRVEADSSYLIPTEELIYAGDTYSIFVRSDSGFIKTRVKIGRQSGGLTELTGPADLFEKEVVLRGNYYLNGM